MKRTRGFTITERSIAVVPQFEMVVRKLSNQVELRGQSKSTPCWRELVARVLRMQSKKLYYFPC